ncbi:DUF6894 family protein [Mesorhizobium sp. ES1-1]|uniref:DUF6894 family protein n=1 Tax=Mesorhizobium sp. ES1-1 TaxID=2876629 RepID=UPI001CCA3EBA|nr:hypothetical protein [Mesorhizobium sp. ES1-1]MBZ9674525.1 hypothetical protein [Mesorhizobium sp. ES1-1]
MPLFHFHVDNGKLVPDPVGTQLPDIDTARSEAVRAAGEMLTDLDGKLWEGDKTWIMHVTDSDQILLFSLTFTGKNAAGKVKFEPET